MCAPERVPMCIFTCAHVGAEVSVCVSSIYICGYEFVQVCVCVYMCTRMGVSAWMCVCL